MTRYIYWLMIGCLLSTFHAGVFAQSTTQKSNQDKGKSEMQSSRTIAQIVATDPRFSMLKTALEAADLTNTLQSPGPFTLFAPTDMAFQEMSDNGMKVNDLLKLENKDRLLVILRYHVVPGRLNLARVQDGQKLKTIETEELSVNRKGDRTMINRGEVQQSPIATSNGVIYVIDKVLIPPRQEEMGNNDGDR